MSDKATSENRRNTEHARRRDEVRSWTWRQAARSSLVVVLGASLALTNVAAGCPGDPPVPPVDVPVLATTAAVGTLPGSTGVSRPIIVGRCGSAKAG